MKKHDHEKLSYEMWEDPEVLSLIAKDIKALQLLLVHVDNRTKHTDKIPDFFAKVAEIIDSHQSEGKSFNQIVSSRTIMILNKLRPVK